MVGSPLCRLLSLLPRREPAEGRPPEKILVTLLSEMGSLVLAQPMFARLRKKYPEAVIFILMFEKNRHCLEVLDLVPPDCVMTIRGDSLMALAGDSLRVLRRLRREQVDTVIDCELFSRISSIYTFLSGASRRVGFHPHTQEGLYRGSFINRRVLYNPSHHMARQFINLAEAVDSTTVPCGKRVVDEQIDRLAPVIPREAESAHFRLRLLDAFPGILDRPLVLLYPSGGPLPVRAWPLENFRQVAVDLLDKGYGIGIIGLPADKPLAEKLTLGIDGGGCFDLTGYTRNVRELVLLLHLAALLITNDGGPGHFAALTPVPSIILYGPETPRLYSPIDPKATTLHAAFSCAPCLSAYNHRNSPCDGDNLCLKSIRPEQVLTKARQVLETTRPPT